MNRKKLTFILIFCLLFLSSCTKTSNSLGDTPNNETTNDFEVGMSYNKALDIIDSEHIFTHQNYIFFKNTNGNNVVVEFGTDTNVIEKIKTFEAVSPDKSSFDNVSDGMNVFEVVKLLGIPTRSATFGLSSVDYEIADGTIFRIIWDGEMKVSETTFIN